MIKLDSLFIIFHRSNFDWIFHCTYFCIHIVERLTRSEVQIMTPNTLIDIRKPRSFFISSPCSCILTTLLSLLEPSSLLDILCLYGVTPLWTLKSTVRLGQNKSSLMLWFFIGWAISSTTYTEIFNIHGVLIKNIRFHLGYNQFFAIWGLTVSAILWTRF